MRKDSAKNSLFSLLSLLFPVLLGLIFIPHFIHDFGKERFSFLSLVWALFGYFSFLDLGIGRTLTKIIAHEKANAESDPSFSFVVSAQYIIFTVSFLFSLLVYISADAIVYRFLQISPQLQPEFISSIRVVAFGIPFVTMTSLNRSILEGFNDFSSANILQILAGTFLFIMPFIAWKIDPSMLTICIAIVFSRAIVYGFSHFFYKKKLPSIDWLASSTFTHFKMLMSHGVWITVSNVLSPIMSSFDKILLGNITFLKNVAFYTTPMEMVSRLWAIPSAVTRIFFPQFAAAENDDRIQQQFRHAGQIMGLFIVPVCLVIYAFAKELISVWIGPEFSAESYPLAQWMIIGILFNAFNWIPFGWLQATKHVHWTVYTVIIEVPLFLMAFYFFTNRYGLIGSAAVWSGRLVFDYFLTYIVCTSFKRRLIKEFTYSFSYLAASTITIVGISLIPDLIIRILVALLTLVTFMFLNRKLIKEMLGR